MAIEIPNEQQTLFLVPQTFKDSQYISLWNARIYFSVEYSLVTNFLSFKNLIYLLLFYTKKRRPLEIYLLFQKQLSCSSFRESYPRYHSMHLEISL